MIRHRRRHRHWNPAHQEHRLSGWQQLQCAAQRHDAGHPASISCRSPGPSTLILRTSTSRSDLPRSCSVPATKSSTTTALPIQSAARLPHWAQNAIFSAGVNTFQISYTGGDGNDVVLEAITGSPVEPGNPAADDFNLRRNGNVIQLRNHGTLIYDSPLGVIQPFGLTINGGDGNDTLTIDYATGGFFALTVAFNGDTQSATPGDKLMSPAEPSPPRPARSPPPATARPVQYGTESATIVYTGLEPVDMTGTTVADLVFNLPATGNVQAILEDDGTSTMAYPAFVRILSPSSRRTSPTPPARSPLRAAAGRRPSRSTPCPTSTLR